MTTCDARGDDDDTTFARTRAEGSTATFDVSAARQLNPRHRQSTTHTKYSVASRAHVKGGTIQR
jgi:hypothetical protein